jgi:TetR/AcrR family transcriptional repressor of nem operon
MRVTKERAAENRKALVDAAGHLIREKGVDGVGVAEISAQAGLTHGALYAQFPSKEALAAEAFTAGFRKSFARVAKLQRGRPALGKYLDALLSTFARDNMADGCPLTASASEVSRHDETMSARFTESYLQMVAAIEAVLDDTDADADNRQRALAIIAGEIGAIAVARAVQKSHPGLSDEILVASRKVLGNVGGEPGRR